MNTQEKAISLRKEGWGYRTIGKKINRSWSTVRRWVRHIKAKEAYKKYNESLLAITDISRFKNKSTIKRILYQKRGYKCESCQRSRWLNRKITIELEHIDGNKKNNKENNLLLLCPNCHSQTPTWRRKKNE